MSNATPGTYSLCALILENQPEIGLLYQYRVNRFLLIFLKKSSFFETYLRSGALNKEKKSSSVLLRGY